MKYPRFYRGIFILLIIFRNIRLFAYEGDDGWVMAEGGDDLFGEIGGFEGDG